MLLYDKIIASYEQAIEDTVPGCMVPCDEQRTKRGTCFPEETGLLHSQKPFGTNVPFNGKDIGKQSTADLNLF